ncbi:ABC transporter permease [Ammoniphilus oxalaticus]|uniref:ABC transporter permease n=1 Tax=Ammoniphilus oxalaticus TaxID=66863 RepID=A0A419SJM0_9BACL|nr:ABC transporter permease [Ammoniphilus oxalaticus]RKD24129.1 ABC transporter permease [Ammoniphilus oxalaticus]
MNNLVYNEMVKLLGKKRLLAVLLMIAILIPLFTYAQFKTAQTIEEKLGTTDWRASLQQQIIDAQNRLSSSRLSDEWREALQIRLAQQQYYLEHNINPSTPGAPTFIRLFLENSISLMLPLFVMVVTVDLISSEYSGGTIKLLLTRPVQRWKVLLSKVFVMILSISLILLAIVCLAYVISGLVFGYGGWNMPLLTGFVAEGADLNTSQVHLIPQWRYILMVLGLAWFVCLVVGSLSFMLSVLVKSAATGMGIMLAALISGVILRNMVSSWESAKYLFMVNLELTGYLSGSPPPIQGMTLGFSLSVLAAWGTLATFVSFWVFTQRDVY